MPTTLYLELTAAAFGVLGTVLLALNGPRAGWGFVAYLASNAGWIAFAWIHSHWGLLAQQLAFTVSSLLGVWVWLVKPPAPRNLMSNADLCEAIALADKMAAADWERPIISSETPRSMQHLAELLDIQIERANAGRRGPQA
jgi:hypothetical protein